MRYLLIVMAALAIAGLAGAADYRPYVNDRFGAAADVPASWSAEPPPTNGDGRRFRSPDGTASLAIYGGLNIWNSPAEALRHAQGARDGETITYRHKGRESITVSGIRNGEIFYRKSILVCRDQILNSIDLTYPVADKAAYDAVVTHIARSLHFSGQSAQVEDCGR